MPGDIEQIVKQRILRCRYWKTHCYTLNAAGICTKAAEIREVGAALANYQPTAYICLVYKLILINPPREIVEELLRQPYFKYLTAIAAFYIRLRYDAFSVHALLEPLLADYRKLRWQHLTSKQLLHVDELIDALLTQNRVFGIALPRMPSRLLLEEAGLAPREPLVSVDYSELV